MHIHKKEETEVMLKVSSEPITRCTNTHKKRGNSEMTTSIGGVWDLATCSHMEMASTPDALNC